MSEPVALSYEVLVSDGVPRKIDLRLPNGDGIVSSPISTTLIYGEQDAVLVDPAKVTGKAATRLRLPPLRAATDRITRITVCTRPFRAQGPRLDVEQIGDKTIVHNYGHGGSGWSLSWGSSTIAVQKAMATGVRDIAVIGCGAL